ncbi:MAG: hypothetical protein AB7P52_17830 [Alphaproteobacteria bacterium]
MPRELDMPTLAARAAYYAAGWVSNQYPRGSDRQPRDRRWAIDSFKKIAYRDEWEALVELIVDRLGGEPKRSFEAAVAELRQHAPRTDEAFDSELAARLAVDREGRHALGRRGRVVVGRRQVGMQLIETETTDSILRRRRLGIRKSDPRYAELRQTWQRVGPLWWPIYAGEAEERERIKLGQRKHIEDGADPIDPIPFPEMALALNARFSYEAVAAGLDAITARLDEGSGASVIKGYTTAQPTDPDVAISGQTLLFTCVASDPAFGAAADQNPGARATAGSITPDSSADATGTVDFCRWSATNDGDTPLDDHIDGSAGVGPYNYDFSTNAIVAGAEVDITAATVDLPQWAA